MSAEVRRHFVQNRLGELLARPGGKTAEQALNEASVLVAELKEPSTEAIRNAAIRIEKLCASGGPVHFSPDDTGQIMRLTDRIITLAATYDYHAIETAGKSLADIVNAMQAEGAVRVSPVAVHARSMRLLAPCGPADDAMAKELLAELDKVRTHLGG